MCQGFSIDKFLLNAGVTLALSRFATKQTSSHASLWTQISNEAKVISETTSREINEFSEKERAKFVNEVFDVRNTVIKQLVSDTNRIDLQLAISEGRLAIYFPTETFNDGTAWQMSDRYFDYYGLPPYSTWMYYFSENELQQLSLPHLLFWIPSQFLESVSNTIKSNSDLSLTLLEDFKEPLCYKKILSSMEIL